MILSLTKSDRYILEKQMSLDSFESATFLPEPTKYSLSKLPGQIFSTQVLINPSRIRQHRDGWQFGLHLHMFNEQPSFSGAQIISESPGKVVVIATGALDTLPLHGSVIRQNLDCVQWIFHQRKDTLSIYYTNLLSDSMQFTLRSNAKQILSHSGCFALKGGKIWNACLFFPQNLLPDLLNLRTLHLPFVLKFNHPIQVTDTEKIQFMSDSLPVKPFHLSFLDSMHTALAFLLPGRSPHITWWFLQELWKICI